MAQAAVYGELVKFIRGMAIKEPENWRE